MHVLPFQKGERRTMQILEAEIERKACEAIAVRLGVPSVKIAKTSEKGYPDRLFLLGEGRVAFIEFKRPKTGVVAEHQTLIHKRLEYYGIPVESCFTVEAALAFIRRLK